MNRHAGSWLDPGLTQGWGVMELQAVIKPRLAVPTDGDSNAGLSVLSAMMFGLAHQRRTGEGQHISMSMLGGNALCYSDDFCTYRDKPARPMTDEDNYGLNALYRLYQCADCGLCRSFCVTDQPLPDAIVAARAEVVAASRAPAAVAQIDAALRSWGSPHPPPPSPMRGEGESDSLLPGVGEGLGVRATTALFVGTAWQSEPASVQAARRLLEQAGLEHALAAVGRSSGYLAYTLGPGVTGPLYAFFFGQIKGFHRAEVGFLLIFYIGAALVGGVVWPFIA